MMKKKNKRRKRRRKKRIHIIDCINDDGILGQRNTVVLQSRQLDGQHSDVTVLCSPDLYDGTVPDVGVVFCQNLGQVNSEVTTENIWVIICKFHHSSVDLLLQNVL